MSHSRRKSQGELADRPADSRLRAQELRHVLLDLVLRSPAAAEEPASTWMEIGRVAAQSLALERAGVWVLAPDGATFRCAAPYSRDEAAPLAGEVIEVGSSPHYGAALQANLILDVNDACTDARTEELADTYLRPRAIGALLHVPVRTSGRITHLLTLESGEVRAWDPHAIEFALLLGPLVALATEAAAAARARAASQVSSERYLKLLDDAPDIICLVDEDGRFRSMNSAFRNLLGWQRRDWLQKPARDLVVAEDLSLVAAAEQQLRQGVKPEPFELRVRSVSGAPVVLDVHVSARREADRLRGAVIVGRDITRRRNAEDRARALLEISRDISQATDIATMLERVGRGLANALACGTVLAFYHHPDSDKSRVVAHHGLPAELQAAIAKLAFIPGEILGDAIRNEAAIVVNDISQAPPRIRAVLGRFPVETAVIVPLHTEGRFLGTLVGLNSLKRVFDAAQIDFCEVIARQASKAIEVIEHSRAEREEATVSAALVRVAQELISSIDTRTLLDRVCRVTADVLGCDISHTFLYRVDDDSFSPVAGFGETAQPWEALSLVRIPRRLVSAVLEDFTREGLFEIRSGRELDPIPPVMLDAFGIDCGLGVPLHRGDTLIGAQTAGYRRGSGRAAFSRTQQRIARGIAQLTSLALENVRLVEQLDQANRVKNEFVATMSHELRTPLNVIIGYTDLLREGAYGTLEAGQGAPLDKVAASARELLNMISATLDVNRLEMGRVAVEAESITLGALARDLGLAVEPPRAEAAVQLRYEIADAPAPIRIDAGKVKTILRNLIGNSLKFTDHGEVVVRLGVEGETLCIEVSDTGIGIPQEQRDAIFQAFHQVDRSVASERGGVGLGLYIVQRLVELMRGSVEVESNVGRGTIFCVRLPLLA